MFGVRCQTLVINRWYFLGQATETRTNDIIQNAIPLHDIQMKNGG